MFGSCRYTYRRLPYVSGVPLRPKSCTLIYTDRGLNAIHPSSHTNLTYLYGITRLGFEILNQSSAATGRAPAFFAPPAVLHGVPQARPLDGLVAHPREVAHDLRRGPRPRRSAARRIELVRRPPASSSSKIVAYLIIHHANPTSTIPTCGIVVAAAVNLRQSCPIPCCGGDSRSLGAARRPRRQRIAWRRLRSVRPHRRAATAVSAALFAGALGGEPPAPGPAAARLAARISARGCSAGSRSPRARGRSRCGPGGLLYSHMSLSPSPSTRRIEIESPTARRLCASSST
jgi:hypothetical protein